MMFLFPVFHSAMTHSGACNSLRFDFGLTIRMIRALAAKRNLSCNQGYHHQRFIITTVCMMTLLPELEKWLNYDVISSFIETIILWT